MATILDLGLLENFAPIFTFILLFALTYAVFQYAKILGDNKSIHALSAFVIALLASLSRGVVRIITLMTPWFVLLFIFVIFIILGLMILGIREKDIMNVVHGDRYGSTLVYWIIILSVVILIASISNVYGSGLLKTREGKVEAGTLVDAPGDGNVTVGEGSTATGSFEVNVYNTLFHPKILGMVVVLLIATFTMLMMSRAKN